MRSERFYNLCFRRKYKPFDEGSQEAQDFENSILKLAQLAKDKIKLSEFTPQDKSSLLDIFVNNEKTLLKMYEILFPRVSNLMSEPQNKSFKTHTYQAGNNFITEPSEYANMITYDSHNLSTSEKAAADLSEDLDLRSVRAR